MKKLSEKLRQALRYPLLCLFALFLLFVFCMDMTATNRQFSEMENRVLTQKPKFTVEKLVANEYTMDYEEYVNDQFIWRDRWITMKSISESALQKIENNGVAFGLDDYMFEKYTAVDQKQLEKNIGFVQEYLEQYPEQKVTLAVIPNSYQVLEEKVPAGFPNVDQEPLIAEMYSRIEGENLQKLDLGPALQAHDDQYIYYRTDHHWTTLGAYYAYKEVMRSYGLEDEILPESAFTRTVATDRFLGTFAAASGFDATPDTLEIWYRGNEDAFAVTADGKELSGGFYSTSYLTGRDCYSVFLDGTHDVVTVQKRGEERPLLLLAKDSFANALAPFLAQHFDLVLLNLSSPRNDFTNLSAAAEQWNADAVLVVYTLGNVICTDRMNRLQ